MKRRILIIPDIHGRNFWKNNVYEGIENCDYILFGGDYLDPYPWEGITRKQAIDNFQEIIDFKSQNKEKVILLIGNHDCPYIDKHNFTTRSRYDSSNAYHIEEMFRSHRSFFQLAHEVEFDKHYLFTHAGLQPNWYEKHKDLIGNLTVDNLNRLMDNPQGIKSLCEASWARGGWDQFGSIVWNDIQDMYKNINNELPWDYQIIFHSQQDSQPVITDTWACLDCRRAFVLNGEGGFQEA